MFELDKISHLVTLDTDLVVCELEQELNRRGFTLGFFSPPSNALSFEEILNQKKPNLYSLTYGELPELCVSLAMETPSGEICSTHLSPRHATGPSWKNLILGSQGAWGTLYRATFKIFPRSTQFFYSIVGMDSLEESFELEREMMRQELWVRAFGRFSRKELKLFPKIVQKQFLILEWGGFDALAEASALQFQEWIEPDYFSFLVEKNSERESVKKLLHQKLPTPGWGNLILPRCNSEGLEWEKKILNTLQEVP